MLKQKPVLSADAPGRTKPGGPLVDPDPEEVITDLGNSHRLLVNKYCIQRPMLVIPTQNYAAQTDDLDRSDIDAAWSVLQVFKTPSLVIYNCGVNAGSSQGHKHLQLLPLPARLLWPSNASSNDISSNIAHVPFKHFVHRLSATSTPASILEIYMRLLRLARTALASSSTESRDYNVALTREWIAVIPRRTATPGGPFGANAAGMLGLVSVPDLQEREWWAELGYTAYLKVLGLPFRE